MSSLFKIALEGRLDEAMAKEQEIAAKAVTGGVRLAASYTQNAYRRQARSAKLGDAVANAWRVQNYPKGPSMNAAAVLYSKAARIVEAFSRDRQVNPISGDGLLVPTKWAIDQKLDRSPSRSRMGGNPRRWLDRRELEQRLGPLFEIRGRRGEVLLCCKDSAGRVHAVAYIVRVVRLRQLLDLEGPRKQFGERLPQYITAAMNRADRRQPRGSITVEVG